MLWYNVGTVAVTLNSKNVTGSGTAWLANVRNGDAFRGPDGQIYLVENVATDTSLTISPAYASATGTGRPYAIVPVQGYQRDLADQVVNLVNSFGATGTAAGGTLTTSPTDSTIGRVVRIADWGLGTAAGVVADPVIINNTANGFYRSGSGTTNGKPVNNSGDAYIKFGWSGAYATYIYGSPISNKLWFKHLNNGADMGWNELMTVGTGGIGSSGAGPADSFPAAKLDATGVGSGMYYYNAAIGDVSDLPFGTATGGDRAGIAYHRMAGTAGAQILVSGSGRLAWRGRNGSNYSVFKEAMAIGQFGFGQAQAAPPNGKAMANPTGFYYAAGAAPSFGGGAFFLDMAYSPSLINSGLRISTDPYTDNFYMNGGISGQKTYRDACKLVHDKNIVGDVAAGSVIATGSNANGTWVRFADGTQICWSPTLTSNWVDVAAGGMYTGQETYWTFPMTFVSSTPYVVHADTTGTNNILWASTGPSRSVSGVGLKINSPIRWNEGFPMRAVAIGRWKA